MEWNTKGRSRARKFRAEIAWQNKAYERDSRYINMRQYNPDESRRDPAIQLYVSVGSARPAERRALTPDAAK